MGWGRRIACSAAAAALGTFAGVAPPADAVPPRICFPVAGRTSFVETFGAPRSGGRSHAGNDLFASRHTPVVAAVDGWLDYVKTDDGGLSGRAIGLIGADGWKYRYIHLDNDSPGTDDGRAPVERGIVPGLAPGVWVLAGQVIGWVGDSGNAETTPPHLHFEIRRPDGVPVTPYPHLRASRACPQPRVVDVAARPGGGAWVLTDDGDVNAIAGAPWLGSPRWGWDIARSIAAMPDGNGYAVLDGYGGVHRYGSATRLAPDSPYHAGQDIARSLDIAPSGDGYAVLRADGTVDVTGSLRLVPRVDLGYLLGLTPWSGGARAIEITDDGLGWVGVDGAGGFHGTGLATVGTLLLGGAGTAQGANGLVLEPLALGAHVLDAGGFVRTAGTAGGGATLPTALQHHPWIGLDAAGGNRVAARADGLVVGW